MPKGVVWRQEDAFYSCFGGGDFTRANPVKTPEEMPERIGNPFVVLPARAVDARRRAVDRVRVADGGRHERADDIAAAHRLRRGVAARHRARGAGAHDHRRRRRPPLDRRVPRPPRPLRRIVADLDRVGRRAAVAVGARGAGRASSRTSILNDGYGASETGAQARSFGGGKFASFDDETLVLDPDTLDIIEAGSGREGRVARRGHIPLGYYNDPEKTAATFVEHDGERWVLTGDVATVLDDGAIQLLGRGSMCINTGGEKVFPEEVESVLLGHPAVYDVIVVGVPDPRWGERVTAVVQVTPGHEVDSDAVVEHCRAQLAGYKVPRAIVTVGAVQRSPVGKADYGWAKEIAVKETT